jgi:3-oxoadipate enol-lactonase
MNRLAHTVSGVRGPWVLLLHGIGGGQSVWDDAASGTARAVAAAGFRAVAVDLPGYGASAAVPPTGIPGMAEAVLGLIDTLDAEAAIVVGHSMGGMVAQEMALLQPARVAGLVLACTSSAFGAPGGDWQARFVAERLAPLDAGLGMAGMAAALVPAMLGPAARAEAAAIAQDVMARVPEATYRAVLQAIVAFDRRAALAQIKAPTLLLAGEHDRTAPPAVMQRMAARIDGAEFVQLPGAGHIANIETPAAFHAALVAFLQRSFSVD